jgi:hypothetical protein
MAAVERGAHGLVVDMFNARLGVGVIGGDRHLPAGEALRLQAQVVQGDGQQADGDLFAG